MVALGVGIYINESVHFYYGDWDFKHDIFMAILNNAELYVCYPMLILTYCSYLFLIGLIYGVNFIFPPRAVHGFFRFDGGVQRQRKRNGSYLESVPSLPYTSVL